jgi:hypothetical protein
LSSLSFDALLSSYLGVISFTFFSLRDSFTADAVSPPVETALATTSRMVDKQNGHIAHLPAAQLDP